MIRPTEEDKKIKSTKEIVKGKMTIKGVEHDIAIIVETTPNLFGYDTKIILPVSPLGSKV